MTFHEPGGQLAGSYTEGQVPGGVPDSPSRAIDRSQNSPPVGLSCILGLGVEELKVTLPPDKATAVDEGLGRGN